MEVAMEDIVHIRLLFVAGLVVLAGVMRRTVNSVPGRGTR
jgi:hypothetical protein